MSDKDVVTYEEMVKFENNEEALIIDVREPNEIEKTGKIGGSINIPLNSLENALNNLGPDEFKSLYGKAKPAETFAVIFSCAMGGRASKALSIAKQSGFNNAKYYKGSWKEWSEKQTNK